MATPVAIVGGGPVGLLLALFLDYYGVACTILIRNPRRAGIRKETGRMRVQWSTIGGSVSRTTFGGSDYPMIILLIRPILRDLALTRSTASLCRTAGNGLPCVARCRFPTKCRNRCFHVNQMYVERFLLERARTRPNIDIRFGWEVDWFTQDETQVRIHARKVGSGEEGLWTAQYAAACDGGRSFIRRTLGIGYEGDVQKKDAYWAGAILFYPYENPGSVSEICRPSASVDVLGRQSRSPYARSYQCSQRQR